AQNQYNYSVLTTAATLSLCLFFFSMLPPQPRSTLFPYTTLFRSIRFEGPKGGPGMREMLAVTGAMKGAGRGADAALVTDGRFIRSEEHTSELQSLAYLVCRLLLEKKKKKQSKNVL